MQVQHQYGLKQIFKKILRVQQEMLCIVTIAMIWSKLHFENFNILEAYV